MRQRNAFGLQFSRIMKKPRDVGFLSKISAFVVTIFLCLGLVILSVGIKRHFVRELEINAQNLASGYNHSLKKTVEASNLVHQLIREKLVLVTGFISNYGQDLQNEDLTKIARTIDVEEIDIYSSYGVIDLSNVEEYIGWIPPEDHPVRNFILSGATSHIDPLRNNTITGHPVLYGYERMDDGRIVQVGINANIVNSLIQGFEVNDMLKEMLSHKEVEYVKYISPAGVVIGSSSDDGSDIGMVLPEPDQNVTLYDALDIGMFQQRPQAMFHEVYEPVMLNGKNAGELVIGISLLGTRNAIRDLNRSVTVVLIMTYLAAILVIYLLNSKNRKLFSLAYEDELTELPNAKYLKRMLKYELTRANKSKLALVLIHVPQFSRLTIARGYEKGNIILQNIARNIEAQQIKGAKLFRYSDEKFMMLVSDYESKEALMNVMDDLSYCIPMEEGDNIEKRLRTLTFGALEITEKYRDVGEALVDVLIALNNVRDDAPMPYAFFDEHMERSIIRENMLYQELRRAIENPQGKTVYLAYQPLIHGKTDKVVAVEALARMKSEYYDMVPPLEFIQIAEKNGLMVSLGQIILEKAVRFAKTMMESGIHIRVAVNISPIQILQEDFVLMVKQAIEAHQLPPEFLELEITESVFLGNYEIVNRKLKSLRELGVLIAIDDFGTGYSSFARLKELHVDAVKIDKYFISKISTLPHNQLIVGDIINMVHKFDLITVAEGVETVMERDYLRDMGCNLFQGYYFAKPLADKKALTYIKNKNIKDDNTSIGSEIEKLDA